MTTKHFGCQSMVAPLQSVIVRRPDDAFVIDDPGKWHYSSRPNLTAAQREHDAIVDVLRQAGTEVIYHRAPLPAHADAIFVHDPAIVTDRGTIILRMSKRLRRGEEEAMATLFSDLGVPIQYTLYGQARAEGGDLLWVDEKTLAVGQGFRTNAEALRQLREALADMDVEIIPVQLPYYSGPEACLHLMSLISIVDDDLAVVYLPLLSAPFVQLLLARNFRLIEVPEQEFETMGSNVLALSPGKCLMLENNPITKQRLEAAGCSVITYKGDEISHKAEGGATCLTRPILRR